MSKFKVGDKVRVRKDLKIGRDYNGLAYTQDMYDGFSAKVLIIDEVHESFDGWYYIKGDREHYGWTDSMLEPADTFTKSDLKDGMVVEYRHGGRELVFGSRSINRYGWHNLEDYTEELTEDKYHFPHHYIDKVYEVNNTHITNLDDVFKDRFLTLIWERKEEPSHKEMTIEEIEKELGYKIKVVAEDK